MAMPKPYFTLEAYLALEASSPDKHEYVNGEIYMMAGGSFRHAIIASQTSAALTVGRKNKSCLVSNSDLRVAAEHAKSYFYPDATVVCGAPEMHPRLPDTVMNPLLIVEVISPTSDAYDRTTKLKAYMSLTSVQHYLLISQDEVRVEHYARQDKGWILRYYTALTDSIDLHTLDCTLQLADIYDQISFDPPA